jgi:hypothetical protein
MNEHIGDRTARHTCKRCRSIGKSANACTENSTRAKTATSVVRRDADIAAFIDKTEVNLERMSILHQTAVIGI